MSEGNCVCALLAKSYGGCSEALLYVYEHRERTKALRTVEKAARSGVAPALFARINE